MSLNSTNISSVLPHAIDRDIAFVSIAERSPMRLAAYILSPNGNIRKGVFECPPDDGQPRPFLEGMHVVAFDMPALIEIMAMDGRVVGDVSYASVKDLARAYMPNADSRSLENLASAIGQKCEKSDPSSQARACMFAYIYLIADKGMWPSDHWVDGVRVPR